MTKHLVPKPVVVLVFFVFAWPSASRAQEESAGGQDSAEYQQAVDQVNSAAETLQDARDAAFDGAGIPSDQTISDLKGASDGYHQAYQNLENVALKEGQPVGESGMDYFYSRYQPKGGPQQ